MLAPMLVLAARLLAADPAGLRGAVVRGRPGPLRDELLGLVRSARPDAPWRRLPLSATADRLLGGIDLGATLAAGRPVAERGLLADVDGGTLVVPMAERLPAALAGPIAAALDSGAVTDALGHCHPARFLLLLLDEGEPDERVPAALADRLGLWLDPDALPADSDGAAEPVGDPVPPICALAEALGIASLRAPAFALRAATALARLEGRSALSSGDLDRAARLTLLLRATRLPADPADAETADRAPPPTPADATPDPSETDDGRDESGGADPAERLIEAARAALPPGLVAELARGQAARPRGSGEGRGAGARAKAPVTGRKAGVRQGRPRPGAPLDLVETLKAAAPWQAVRRPSGAALLPLRIRPDDFRVRRLQRRQGSTIILLVDASGSAALARLGEAKGAAELLLADAYVRRDEVALIAFRGTAAELLLPPTRSLARAKRALADLVAGGGTPLAAALQSAEALAAGVRARGRSPLLVLLTDGRANVAADGADPRAAAAAAARRLAAAGFPILFLDTAARPRGEGLALATAMRARHLPLPRVEAHAVRQAVRALAPA